MTAVAVHACDLERLDGLLFAKDPDALLVVTL